MSESTKLKDEKNLEEDIIRSKDRQNYCSIFSDTVAEYLDLDNYNEISVVVQFKGEKTGKLYKSYSYTIATTRSKTYGLIKSISCCGDERVVSDLIDSVIHEMDEADYIFITTRDHRLCSLLLKKPFKPVRNYNYPRGQFKSFPSGWYVM